MTIENETFSANDRIKLKTFMDQAMVVFQNIDDLKGGLKDTAGALSEEFNIKPAQLMKAARIAFKASLTDEREAFSVVEELLILSGRDI